jgi:thiol-disulfide isomerase/thioredoxin
MKKQIPYKKLALKIIPLAVAGLLISTQPATAVLQKGELAPPVKLVTTAGQPITLSNYKGYVLVMDFFATWCIPCKESIPHLNSLNRKYGKQGLQILGVNVDEGNDREVRNFITERKVSYPVAFVGEDMQTDYGLRSIPTVYVINKKGMVADKFQGYSDQTGKAMEESIKRLLAE